MRRWGWRLGRWVAVAAIAAALFALGAYPEAVFASLTTFWHEVFVRLGLAGWLARMQQGTSHEVTTRSLPVVVSYSVGYLALCLLLLNLLLPDATARNWAWRLYAAAAALCAALLLLGKLGGDLPLLYRAGRTIIDFLVSPLPVMALLALLSTNVRKHLLNS